MLLERQVLFPLPFNESILFCFLTFVVVLSQDSTDNIIVAKGCVVSLLGVENLIVVRNGDNILVAHKDKGQEIKKIVTQYNNYLTSQKSNK